MANYSPDIICLGNPYRRNQNGETRWDVGLHDLNDMSPDKPHLVLER